MPGGVGQAMPYFCCEKFVQIFNFRLKSHRYALNLLPFVVDRHFLLLFLFWFLFSSNLINVAVLAVVAYVQSLCFWPLLLLL